MAPIGIHANTWLHIVAVVLTGSTYWNAPLLGNVGGDVDKYFSFNFTVEKE